MEKKRGYKITFGDSMLLGVERGEKYPDLASSLDIANGTDCFVVWLSYFTGGDTFHPSEEVENRALGVFIDKFAAETAAKAIKTLHQGISDKSVNNWDLLKFATKDGQNFEVFPDWEGYFERLIGVYITKATMGTTPKTINFLSD